MYPVSRVTVVAVEVIAPHYEHRKSQENVWSLGVAAIKREKAKAVWLVGECCAEFAMPPWSVSVPEGPRLTDHD